MVTTNRYAEVVAQVPTEARSSLDEPVRQGAQRMLAAAVEGELAEYIARHQDARSDSGRALVVRNGRARERTVATSAGAITVRAPRVNDQREGQQFRRQLLPPYMRRSPRLEEVAA